MPKNNKPNKLSNFLDKIKKPIGGLLEFAGDITDIGFIEKAGNLIKGSTDLTPEEKEMAMQFLSQDVEDRKSAREMQAKIATSSEAGWLAKNFIYVLASVTSISAIVFGFMLFFVDFPESNKRLVEMFADIYVFSGALMILNFFFGSSEGSKTKDKIMGN
jgi:hypothetical protein